MTWQQNRALNGKQTNMPQTYACFMFIWPYKYKLDMKRLWFFDRFQYFTFYSRTMRRNKSMLNTNFFSVFQMKFIEYIEQLKYGLISYFLQHTNTARTNVCAHCGLHQFLLFYICIFYFECSFCSHGKLH